MSLPKTEYRGQRATITMNELRGHLGEAIDKVRHGLVVETTKGGKTAALLVPVDYSDDNAITIVKPDGTVVGPPLITAKRNLGNGGYGD